MSLLSIALQFMIISLYSSKSTRGLAQNYLKMLERLTFTLRPSYLKQHYYYFKKPTETSPKVLYYFSGVKETSLCAKCRKTKPWYREMVLISLQKHT